jgi:hypothetical protein
MSVYEVLVNFMSDRKHLLDRHRFGTEQALARAGFLDTADLVTLQAFVLYLTIIWVDGNSHFGWALSRSAIAVAQSLGLHRDRSNFRLPPFECEMRRRLWWQLCILDFRHAEKQGTEPSIAAGTFDTKLPLNINDSDLLPNTTTAPEPRVGLTEMTMTLLASEVTSAIFTLHRAMNNNSPLPSLTGSKASGGKEAIIQEFSQHLQDTYVKHCTDSSPTAWVASNMCQLIIYKMESILLRPLNQAVSNPEIAKEASDEVFVKSIKILSSPRRLHGSWRTLQCKIWVWIWMDSKQTCNGRDWMTSCKKSTLQSVMALRMSPVDGIHFGKKSEQKFLQIQLSHDSK